LAIKKNMSFFNWRKLNFFDITKDVDNGTIAKNLGEGGEMTCVATGSGNLILGDSNGNINIYNRHWESYCIPGWDGCVLQLFLPRKSNFLFGLGEDKGVRCLKVWDLDKTGDSRGVAVRVSRLSLPGSPSEAECFAVNENLQMLAVGYQNGAVTLLRGDATRDRGGSSKAKYLVERGEPVSGLSFVVTSSAILLYSVTARDVILYNVTAKDRETSQVLDNLGCEKGLGVATNNYADAHYITGQKDALYFYNPEGRGQCYVFEGKKKAVNWFRGYLSVATEEANGKDSMTVFDVQNKIICFSAPVRPILALASEWGTILLISRDGRLIQLVEKDLQSKLEILFKKNFYDVAIKVARHQNLDKEGLVDIFRQYGDHLYDKGDHSGAIDQYEKTIGSLEPSYVIRKFLDTQKIHNLTAYLQALHRKGEATEDHTTLLLNCYTKLKDSKNLDEFIMTKDREVDFDVDIAISVCRQAGYFRHALSLAEKHRKHDLYLKIQIDDEKDYQKALKYMSLLSPGELEDQLKLYGSILLEHLPQETTAILKSLCDQPSFRPQFFIPLFINNAASMLDFLEHVVEHVSNVTSQVWNTLLEYNLHMYKAAGGSKERETRIMDILTGDKSNYDSDQALVLCQLNHFSPGFIFLYQKAGLHEQILKYHFQAGNYEDGIITCRRFGPQNPNLWISALQSVASSGADVPQQYFKEVLENIEKNRLLSPLLVVTTLSSCPTATLGVVREYLMRTLRAEEESMTDDRKMIDEYTKDTAALRENIQNLKTEAVVFQSTKCSACGNPLELPTVHFLCGHGYHQHCFQALADNDQECPKCAEENNKILDIIRSQEAGKGKHDQFHAQLEKAEDGFSIVAEYFGRGLFSQPPPIPPIENPALKPGPQGITENMSSLGLSEARMRAAERQNPDTYSGLQAESRIRVGERSAYGSAASSSEARIRVAAGTTTGGRVEQSEARLRSDMRGPGPQSVQSDARMRLGEGSRLAQESLNSNITRPNVGRNQSGMRVPGIQQPSQGRSISPQNPFGSPDSQESLDQNNPFAEQKSNNPFGSPDRSLDSPGRRGGGTETGGNPFGDDTDRDLNPFGEC